MHRRLSVLIILGAATLAHGQAIQVPPVPVRSNVSPVNVSQPSATIRQEVKNVLVDVVVTDKYGQPIKNLGKEHLQIFENGAQQQVSYFEEHQADAAPAAAPLHPWQLPADVFTNVATSAPDNGPTLVLLMDALNTPSADQVKVRLAMLDYLRKIPLGRHIAIFLLTSKLRMVQGFNGDPATLIAALDDAANWQKQSHLTDDRGQDSYADTAPKAQVGSGISNASNVLSNFVAHEQAWKIDERVGFTLNALEGLATYLSALPGRKNVIWFSGSFPLGIGPDSPMPAGFDPSTFTSENLGRSRDYNDQLHDTSELLKQARVAVYPVAAGGLQSPSTYTTVRANNDTLHDSASLISSLNAESSSDLAAYATMDTLAESTGGRAFHSTNDLAGAISSVAQLGSDYYTIAYVPKGNNYDGKYRKLAIKVDVSKAKLDYRRGYYAVDPDTSGPGLVTHPTNTTAALLHGAPAATDILFKVRVAPAEAHVDNPRPGVARYSINWSLDLHGVALQQGANDMRRGALTLAAVAYNGDSKAVNQVSMPVSLILKPDEYAKYLKSGLQFHQEIDLPGGPIYLRVAVVESSSNRAGATEIPLSVKIATVH